MTQMTQFDRRRPGFAAPQLTPEVYSGYRAKLYDEAPKALSWLGALTYDSAEVVMG